MDEQLEREVDDALAAGMVRHVRDRFEGLVWYLDGLLGEEGHEVRDQPENKMIRAVHADTDRCECARCRVQRLGLPLGQPLTPAEFALVNPPVERPATEPETRAGVKAAAVAMAAERAAYDDVTVALGQAVLALRAVEFAARTKPVYFDSTLAPLPALSQREAAELRRLNGKVEELIHKRRQAAERLGRAQVAHTEAARRR